MRKKKWNYDNRIVIKPWGQEYNIYRDKKKIAITYLKIKKNHSTSLHCHPSKKTGFLILSGVARVQIGIYNYNFKKYLKNAILVLRPGLFHRLTAEKDDLYALEIEAPYDKNDIIRLYDNYGRSNSGYESLDKTKKISSDDIIFTKPKKNKTSTYRLNGNNIKISYINKKDQLKNFNKRSVSIILDGKIINKSNKTVIEHGEIVKTETIVELLKNFKIKRKLLLLTN